MAPGGEMFRYPQHFGENVLRHGSHEWLPYSVDEVRLKSSNTNFPVCFVKWVFAFRFSVKRKLRISFIEPKIYPFFPANG